MSRDISAAADRLMRADDEELKTIARHDPSMIRDVAAAFAAPSPALDRATVEALRALIVEHCHVNMKWPATSQIADHHVEPFVAALRALLASPAPSGESVTSTVQTYCPMCKSQQASEFRGKAFYCLVCAHMTDGKPNSFSQTERGQS